MIGIPQRFCEAKDLREEEEQAVKAWRLPKADAREIRLAPTRARRQRRKSRHLNQKSEICFCGSPIFCCGNSVWMCKLLVQSQARSRGKGSRADTKADAWEKGEQALFCQSPGGALTACELGNGTWNVPFPDRARTLPRETNKPPGQAARNAAAGFAALFRRRGSWVPPSPRPSLLHEKAARQKTMKNNAFFMSFCYFDFEKEKYGSYSIVLGKTYVRI